MPGIDAIAYAGEKDTSTGVDRALSQIQKALAELDNTIDDVVGRLGLVLRPEEPSASSERLTSVGRTSSPLAEAVESLAASVNRAQGRLAGLLSRVDL